MQSDPGHHNAPKFPWLFLAAVIAGTVSLGWWIFRPAKAPEHPVKPAAPAASLAHFSPAIDNTPADPYRTAGYSELLDLLRDKLSGSPDGVLAALAKIARNRPELALDLAQALARTENEKDAWVQAIVKVWAGHDSQQAWNWVAQPGNQLANIMVVSVVMNAMATSDPATLIGKVDTLLHQTDTNGPLAAQSSVYLSLQALINSGNTNLAQAAVESWAKDPNNLNIGSAAYDLVALSLEKKSPQSAATWLLSMPDSDNRNSSIGTFAYAWGQTDPVAAINWAQNLGPQEGQSEVVSRVFSEWIQNNATAATNWLDNYITNTPGSVEGDTMIGSLILFSPTVKNDPNEAMKLAASISNSQTRAIYEEQIVQSWARSDLTAAITYLQTNQNIAPEQKKLLIQQAHEAQSPNPAEQ